MKFDFEITKKDIWNVVKIAIIIVALELLILSVIVFWFDTFLMHERLNDHQDFAHSRAVNHTASNTEWHDFLNDRISTHANYTREVRGNHTEIINEIHENVWNRLNVLEAHHNLP